MYIPPVASDMVTAVAKKANFFSSRTPMGAIDAKHIISSNILPAVKVFEVPQAPKSELEKITRIFW